MSIVGRKKEIEELERLYCSENSEFIAVYGRRPDFDNAAP